MPKIRGHNETVVYDQGKDQPETKSDGMIMTMSGSLIEVYSTRSGEYFGYPPYILSGSL